MAATFNKDNWEAVYKQAAKDMPGHGASDGMVCVLATLRYIGSQLDPKGKQACKELYESCQTAKSISGFASNASSAAKACGLGGEKAATFAGF